MKNYPSLKSNKSKHPYGKKGAKPKINVKQNAAMEPDADDQTTVGGMMRAFKRG